MEKILRICIILCIVAIVILVNRLNPMEPETINIYEFGQQEYPRIVLIGSVHGNEPAGTLSLEQTLLDRSGELNQFPGKLIIIPRPNPTGILRNIRSGFDPQQGEIDINRTYLCNGTNCPAITNLIKSYVNSADLVVEFHEAYDFHKINPGSLGSCIVPTSHVPANVMSEEIVQVLNNTVSDVNKKFIRLVRDSCEIPSTLACYSENHNIPYILVEITGQLNKQPIEKRVQQVRTISDTVINKYMIG